VHGLPADCDSGNVPGSFCGPARKVEAITETAGGALPPSSVRGDVGGRESAKRQAEVSVGGASSAPPNASSLVARLRAAGCVFAEEEARLLTADAASPAELAGMVERRISGVPVEHVLGWAEFGGLRIAVEPGVFVPRRRTVFLVERAAAVLAESAAAEPPGVSSAARGTPVVVDMCCGSGAVGAALRARVDGPVELHACDVDPAAVRCARRNLAAAGHDVHQGDLFGALPGRLRGQVDVLVANVPYVPAEEIALLPPEARLHEPHTALEGGADGLDVLRRVAQGAPAWLRPGGCLLVETSERQLPAAVEAVESRGLSARAAVCEESGTAVVTAVRPALNTRPAGS
jgi:release factor glutamine methyltransferase